MGERPGGARGIEMPGGAKKGGSRSGGGLCRSWVSLRVAAAWAREGARGEMPEGCERQARPVAANVVVGLGEPEDELVWSEWDSGRRPMMGESVDAVEVVETLTLDPTKGDHRFDEAIGAGAKRGGVVEVEDVEDRRGCVGEVLNVLSEFDGGELDQGEATGGRSDI